MAVDNVWYDNQGKKHEECDFIPITTYGKQAENDAKYLKKGVSVAVTGRIRSWYNQGQRKGGFNFEAERVQYLGRPASGPARQEEDLSDLDEWVRDYDQAGQARQERR